jgi:hypothetical protein
LNKINEQKEKENTFSKSVNEREMSINQNDDNNNVNNGENIKINTASTEKTEECKTPTINNNNNNNNISNININQNVDNSLSRKIDLFDKKIKDLESLLKEKIVEVLYQVDNLQNILYYSLNQKSQVKKKSSNNLNNINHSMNTNPNSNSNINLNEHNDFATNVKSYSSHDDYFIHSHSVKKFAPIIEIDPIKLQFSPSPSRSLLGSKKIKEQNKSKGFKYEFTNHFKDIKLIRKNDNKENINSNNNNIIDNFNLTQFRLLSKNGIGVNKWININKLLNFEQTKNNISSSTNGELLAKFDNN